MDTVKARAGAESLILMNSLGELERTWRAAERNLREKVERLMERKNQEELGETEITDIFTMQNFIMRFFDVHCW